MSFQPDDPWLVPFLNAMRRAPGTVLGEEGIDQLELYVSAYTRARVDLGAPPFGRGEEALLSDYARWLSTRLNQTDEAGWASVGRMLDPSPRGARRFLSEFKVFMKEARGVELDDGSVPPWPPKG